MKLIIVLSYFALFGVIWPYWVGGRTRGNVTVLCLAAPWVAFWLGYFAK